MPRRGGAPRFSDLEVIALSLTAEKFSVDSESYLFSLLEEYKFDIPNLISRRQFNDRRKFTSNLCTNTKEYCSQLMQAEEYDKKIHPLIKKYNNCKDSNQLNFYNKRRYYDRSFFFITYSYYYHSDMW